jgi:YegS/Rv2252/BmrU family lipid kinase
VRICVIFNPTARGNKARRFRSQLDGIRAHAALKQTTCAGDARRLAAEAVRDGFDVVVAAGGDGTVNEVLNGLGDAPGGFALARLGILPLGTVNVLARELGLPLAAQPAWEIILRGHEARVDLPWAEWNAGGSIVRRYFAQLAGAGLDARAVELVRWPLKKKIGPLAYVIAGLQALRERAPRITASDGQTVAAGELVLLGNGRLYGGPFVLFPRARRDDGLLDVTVLPRAGWATLLRCAPVLLICKRLPVRVGQRLCGANLILTSDGRVPFELDGELVGHLPATFGVEAGALRVAVP